MHNNRVPKKMLNYRQMHETWNNFQQTITRRGRNGSIKAQLMTDDDDDNDDDDYHVTLITPVFVSQQALTPLDKPVNAVWG